MTAAGSLDLVTEEETEKNPHLSQTKKSIEKIQRFSASLVRIVEGKTEEPQIVEINSLVSEIIRWVNPRHKLNTKVIFKPSEERITISGFDLRIQQIVMNLLINSIEAIGNRGGEITIMTGRRIFGAEELKENLTSSNLPEGEYAFIQIEDNGCGMSKETQKKMFEPFFTTKSYGKGLGLLSVRTAVEMHNGGIFVESVEQKGTKFEIILPVAK